MVESKDGAPPKGLGRDKNQLRSFAHGSHLLMISPKTDKKCVCSTATCFTLQILHRQGDALLQALAWDFGCVGHRKGQPDGLGGLPVLHNHASPLPLSTAPPLPLIPLSHGAPVKDRQPEATATRDYENS